MSTPEDRYEQNSNWIACSMPRSSTIISTDLDCKLEGMLLVNAVPAFANVSATSQLAVWSMSIQSFWIKVSHIDLECDRNVQEAVCFFTLPNIRWCRINPVSQNISTQIMSPIWMHLKLKRMPLDDSIN